MELSIRNLSLEELEQMNASIEAAILDARNTTVCKLNEAVQKHLSGWEAAYLGSSSFSLRFRTGTYNDGVTPHYDGLDFYFEPNSKTGKFEVRMNVSARGSFNISEPSDNLTYYSGVGKVLSTPMLINDMKVILKEYYDLYETESHKEYAIEAEISRRNKEAAEKKAEETFMANVPNIKKNLEDFNYVVFRKDIKKTHGDILYRKKRYIASYFGDSDIECYLWLQHNTSYRDRAEFKVVEVEKVKAVEIY